MKKRRPFIKVYVVIQKRGIMQKREFKLGQ